VIFLIRADEGGTWGEGGNRLGEIGPQQIYCDTISSFSGHTILRGKALRNPPRSFVEYPAKSRTTSTPLRKL